MKKTLPIFLILLLLIYASSCEKDDICVDGDTPQLVIGFYDVEDTTEFKSVPSLRIRAVDIESIFTNSSFTDRSNSPDSLLIPLRVDANNTTYEFISDSADDETTGDETGNSVAFTITYEIREEFISRACGFVINYDNLNIALPNSENWIQDIRIVQQTIENTDNIHVKIFH